MPLLTQGDLIIQTNWKNKNCLLFFIRRVTRLWLNPHNEKLKPAEISLAATNAPRPLMPIIRLPEVTSCIWIEEQNCESRTKEDSSFVNEMIVESGTQLVKVKVARVHLLDESRVVVEHWIFFLLFIQPSHQSRHFFWAWKKAYFIIIFSYFF